ncbi:hypothetical protein N7457_002096 [Penicillium paradoxum]|uniref:uncharacterized protein n=1 Tax=Penicillium paradoxum TaxID=176176 RepID=UPI002548D0B2|nr:uncharacterized protein N7457_002096 [Penicillium paradoxum]KAJ5787106.1 hypothetical protein N7457_002096 [Penicillium paradoxum]
MEPIRKVALLGRGMLGSAVLAQLIDAGFQVTVLSRTASSMDESHSSVRTMQVDYSSIDKLVTALQGQDAVVSTVGTSGISIQKTVIDASIRAGIRRFIPSDFGALTTRPGAESLPLNAPWIEIQSYLTEKALGGQIEYTLFAVGPFLEFVMSMPFLIDLQTQIATVYDNGTHPFSSTSVSSVGKAIAGALKNATATKNRLVSVHDTVLTQNRVLRLAKKYSGPDIEWVENPVDAAIELDTILTNTKQGDLDLFKTLALLKAALLSGRFETEFKAVDNDLVGVPIISEDEFENIFAAAFKPNQMITHDELQSNIEGIQG